MKRSFSLIFALVIFSSLLLEARIFPAKAVCKVFVANAFNDYVATKANTQDSAEITRLYHEVLATNKNDNEFTRVHQVLLHEIVEVIEQKGPELLVRCSDSFSQPTPDEKPWYTYAVLGEEFAYLDELDHPECLPQPLEWWNKDSYKPTGTVFTLGFHYLARFRIPEYNFSAGTRFLIKELHGQEVTVYYLTSQNTLTEMDFRLNDGSINDQKSETEIQGCIVHEFNLACGQGSESGNNRSKITTVWGGRSSEDDLVFVPKNYTQKRLTLSGTTVEGFDREWAVGRNKDIHLTAKVRRGADMPGLNGLISTICGAEQLAKNTFGYWHQTPTLPEGQAIKNGDLILATPGYIGRVISVEDNLIGDIRSYTHHDGMARVVKLSENFEGIETYNDLVKAHHEGKQLNLWNKDQTRIIASYKAYNPTTYKAGDRVWKIGVGRAKYTDEEWAHFASMHTPSPLDPISPTA